METHFLPKSSTQDKRSGFGVCERSDGLKYEGEWFNNKKHGYGRTTFPDGSREQGKYMNNVLMNQSRRLPLLRTSKAKERVDGAIIAAQQACKQGLEKGETAEQRLVIHRERMICW